MKTLLLWLLLALPLQAGLVPTNALPVVELTWDPEQDASYNVYWGTASRVYTQIVSAGTTNFVTIVLPVRGIPYFFAVTAIVAGLESNFSDEINWTPDLPPPPPRHPQTLILSVQVQGQPGETWSNTGMDWAFAPVFPNALYRLKIVPAKSGP